MVRISKATRIDNLTILIDKFQVQRSVYSSNLELSLPLDKHEGR